MATEMKLDEYQHLLNGFFRIAKDNDCLAAGVAFFDNKSSQNKYLLRKPHFQAPVMMVNFVPSL